MAFANYPVHVMRFRIATPDGAEAYAATLRMGPELHQERMCTSPFNTSSHEQRN